MTDRDIRAEQALLGAVLSDPAGQQHILDLVRPDDMRRPYHGQVLAAMQRLRARGVQPGPHEVRAELTRDPDLPAETSHRVVYLADLMEAAPRPEHSGAYAAMVIDGGIRQQLALSGSRMAQAAGDPDADLEAALFGAGQARRELEASRSRWEALPEPMRRELRTPSRDEGDYAEAARRAQAVRDEIGRLRADLWTQNSADVEKRLASIAQELAETAAASADQRERQAQRRASREARPQGTEAETAGTAALRNLAADPAQIARVRDWLQPGHFARPEHGEIYRTMRDLEAAGKPVDPVTVSWEAARKGIQIDADGLAGGTGVFAAASAREVHRRALLAQIAQAGRDIQASADDPALSPRLLMRDAEDRLHRLERDPRPEPQPEPDSDARVITMRRQAAGRPEPRERGREATR